MKVIGFDLQTSRLLLTIVSGTIYLTAAFFSPAVVDRIERRAAEKLEDMDDEMFLSNPSCLCGRRARDDLDRLALGFHRRKKLARMLDGEFAVTGVTPDKIAKK